MTDDGEEQRLGGENGGPNDESEPLIQSPHSRFRQGRQPQCAGRWSVCSGLILPVFKVFFCSLGLWGDRKWNYFPRVLLLLISITQAGNQIAVDCGCPFFNCSDYNKTLPNKIVFLPTRKTCFTIFSLAAFLSYSIFLVCLRASRSKVAAMMYPSKSVVDVVDGKEITMLFLISVIIMASFLSGIVLFFSVQFKSNGIYTDNLKLTCVVAAAVALTHWASFSACHVFAISSLSLGKYSVLEHFFLKGRKLTLCLRIKTNVALRLNGLDCATAIDYSTLSKFCVHDQVQLNAEGRKFASIFTASPKAG